MEEKFMDFYTKAEIDAMLNGLSFMKISKADFDEIAEKSPDTIYYVYDENNKITQYMGDAKLSSGTFAGNSVLMLSDVLHGELVNATEAE